MTLDTLKKMNSDQLFEMFEDMNDLDFVEVIGDVALRFIKNKVFTSDRFLPGKTEAHYFDEADGLQRYRDIKSTQDN